MILNLTQSNLNSSKTINFEINFICLNKLGRSKHFVSTKIIPLDINAAHNENEDGEIIFQIL